MKICPKCGYENLKNETINCEKCRESLEEVETKSILHSKRAGGILASIIVAIGVIFNYVIPQINIWQDKGESSQIFEKIVITDNKIDYSELEKYTPNSDSGKKMKAKMIKVIAAIGDIEDLVNEDGKISDLEQQVLDNNIELISYMKEHGSSFIMQNSNLVSDDKQVLETYNAKIIKNQELAKKYEQELIDNYYNNLNK